MVNKIWAFFILSGVLYCVLTGNLQVLNEEILLSADTALNLICKIFPVMALWLGIMKIAENSGLLRKLSKKVSKFLKYLFPEIPENHESLSYIASNVICNMFGLGNAATPFGLKAMQSLQTLNPKKDTASKSMITFLVMNTSGLTIVPTTILSLRIFHQSVNPTTIVFPCILATLISTMVGLFGNYLLSRRR